MDGRALQERVKAIRVEVAAIQDSEAVYRNTKPRSRIQKVAHKARREALENIKQELAYLSKRKAE